MDVLTYAILNKKIIEISQGSSLNLKNGTGNASVINDSEVGWVKLKFNADHTVSWESVDVGDGV